MGDLLTNAGVAGQISKEAAQKFYDEFDVTFVDYAFDEEDLKFAFDNFGFFTPEQARALFLSADDDAGIWGGTIAGRIDPTKQDIKQAWWIFAGAYYNLGTPSARTTVRISNYLKDLGGISVLFDGMSATYDFFNFNKFSENLTRAINEWLVDDDPEINDAGSVSGASKENLFGMEVDGKRYTFDGPGSLSKQIGDFRDLRKSELFEAALDKTSLAKSKKAKWSNPIGNETAKSTFEFESNLTEVKNLQFSPYDFVLLGVPLGEEVSTNWIQIFYFSFFFKVLMQNVRYYRAVTSADPTVRANARDSFDFTALKTSYNEAIDRAVNKTGGLPSFGDIISPSDWKLSEANNVIGNRIAGNIVRKIRQAAAQDLFNKIKDGEIVEESALDSAIKDSFKNAEDSARDNEEISGKDTDPEELSDDDIAAKQKFLKQCLLMSRLKDLAAMNIDYIKNGKNSVHKKKPYKGRLYLVDEKNQNKDKSSIINKLLIPNSTAIGSFLNIKPSEHASLVPKIRLVKVFNSGSALKEHEFKFPKHTNSSRVNDLFSTDFDRGSDFGVKEFSFSFDGTSPATAKNDIKADLTLYFQSFKDFVEPKAANGGHRYVDLLILPAKDNGKKRGSGKSSALQFNPSYYRIRADIGWEASSAPDARIKKAIQKINKTFYLNMVDHEIDIRDDGSVEIKVSYRAYIESALKGTTLDAMASRESRKALVDLQREYDKVLKSKNCNLEQLTLIRAQYLQIEENLRKNSFQSIMKRLIDYQLLKYVVVNGNSASSFERTGYISAPAVFESGFVADKGDEIEEKSEGQNFILRKNNFRDISLSNSRDNRMINYFYLADLLYVILDCLYESNGELINEQYSQDTENFKFLLTSFQYISVFENSQTESVNIGNIPISVEMFNEWYTENVIKPDRRSYPVMYFIRDLTKYLITEILMESCFKNDLDKRLQFKTNSFLGKRKGNGKQDPIGELLNKEVILDVGKHYKKGDLPLSADIEGISTSIGDLYNYITIYAEAPRGITDKVGNKEDDELNGIMHYQLGRDRGILKKIKFSKSDMQYIREARFFRHGNDGLMQLSAVYKVSMDMVGNTLYYPGMEVFIDPRGLIGAGTMFDPTKGNVGDTEASIANKMGFGGYHLVTSVKSSIGPGKFTTNVEALFSYSGDGDPRSKIIGSKEEITVPAIDKEFINDNSQRPSQRTYCESISNELYVQNSELFYGEREEYTNVGDKIEEEFEQNSITEIVDPNLNPLTGTPESDLDLEVLDGFPTSELDDD